MGKEGHAWILVDNHFFQRSWVGKGQIKFAFNSSFKEQWLFCHIRTSLTLKKEVAKHSSTAAIYYQI